MIVNGGGAALIVIESGLVADCWLGTVESSTLNVVEVVPEVVGVPVMVPFAPTDRPGGIAVVLLQVYGEVPPEAASGRAVYAWPIVPAGNGDVVVIVTGVTLALIRKV